MHVTHQEALAVVLGVDKFKHYLMGTSATLFTDHSALTWLLRKDHEDLRFMRWKLAIQGMDLNVVHTPGRANNRPDALSQSPLPVEEGPLPSLSHKIVSAVLEGLEQTPDGYRLSNGLVYRVDRKVPLMCIPESLRPVVLGLSHDYCSHFGAPRTIKRVTTRFFLAIS